MCHNVVSGVCGVCPGSVLTFLHFLLGSFKSPHGTAHRHRVDSKIIADLGHRIRTGYIGLSHRFISTRRTLLIVLERHSEGSPLGFRDLPEFFRVFLVIVVLDEGLITQQSLMSSLTQWGGQPFPFQRTLPVGLNGASPLPVKLAKKPVHLQPRWHTRLSNHGQVAAPRPLLRFGDHAGTERV